MPKANTGAICDMVEERGKGQDYLIRLTPTRANVYFWRNCYDDVGWALWFTCRKHLLVKRLAEHEQGFFRGMASRMKHRIKKAKGI